MQLIHETRDEGGRWFYESAGGRYTKRRPGQARHEITFEELSAAMSPPAPVTYDTPDPASVWERPNFGPRSVR